MKKRFLSLIMVGMLTMGICTNSSAAQSSQGVTVMPEVERPEVKLLDFMDKSILWALIGKGNWILKGKNKKWSTITVSAVRNWDGSLGDIGFLTCGLIVKYIMTKIYRR